MQSFLYISKSVVLPAHTEYRSLIFLPILRSKYCTILKLKLMTFPFYIVLGFQLQGVRCLDLVLSFRERNNFIQLKNNIVLYLQNYNTQNWFLSKSEARVHLKIFLKFQLRCSYEIYSYKKKVWLTQMTTKTSTHLFSVNKFSVFL